MCAKTFFLCVCVAFKSRATLCHLITALWFHVKTVNMLCLFCAPRQGSCFYLMNVFKKIFSVAVDAVQVLLFSTAVEEICVIKEM